jgi:hypothetical protein
MRWAPAFTRMSGKPKYVIPVSAKPKTGTHELQIYQADGDGRAASPNFGVNGSRSCFANRDDT